MRFSILILALSAASVSLAQTKVEKTIPLQAGQKISLDFEYPEVQLETWDRKEVMIQGTVSINHGENDGAFDLQVESTSTLLMVTAILKDKENIPKRLTIKKGDQEFLFKTTNYNDPEVRKFLDENGGEYNYMSVGIITDIKLKVFVPKNVETSLVAKFGLVEVKQFDGPLKIDSKFGKVDATVLTAATGELIVRSRHGEILTNLPIKFDQNTFDSKKKDHWTEITAHPGKGPKWFIESKFGNVYLRKPE